MFSGRSVVVVAETITVTMSKIFGSIVPSEFHDGNWQVFILLLFLVSYFLFLISLLFLIYYLLLLMGFNHFFLKGEQRKLNAPNLEKLGLLFNQLSFLCIVEILYSETEREQFQALMNCFELASVLKLVFLSSLFLFYVSLFQFYLFFFFLTLFFSLSLSFFLF